MPDIPPPTSVSPRPPPPPEPTMATARAGHCGPKRDRLVGKDCIVAGVDMGHAAGSVTSIMARRAAGSRPPADAEPDARAHPSAAMAGEVRLDGVDIYAADSGPPLMRLRIGMVFQKPNPFPT